MTAWYDAPPPPGPWQKGARDGAVSSDELYERAACRKLDPAMFFPRRKDGGFIAPEAVAACRRCPVSAACLAFAMSISEADDYGYWGGTTAQQRREMRRAIRRHRRREWRNV